MPQHRPHPCALRLAATRPPQPLPGRRQVLRAALAGVAASGLAACGSTPSGRTSGAAAPVTDPQVLYHAVNRVTWGATPSALAEAQRLGYPRWLDQQLRPGPPAVLPQAIQSRIDSLRVSTTPLLPLLQELEVQRKAIAGQPNEETRVAANQAYQQTLSALARESANRHLWRAVYSPQQLREQMTWFWFNHFNVHQAKANLRAMVGDYEDQAIRPHALGRFRELLGAVVQHPAMLRYLDNEQNAANRLNENFARELMELHTLGVDGGYRQEDVQALARVLTGLGLSLAEATPARLRPEQVALYRRDGAFEFHPARHDMGLKQLLGQTVLGRGMDEVGEVLDLLARHPSTARHVSRRMAVFFLSDKPPPALVERMARRFLDSQGRIDACLEVLFTSAEFLAPPSAGQAGKFKDPVHFVVSSVRASSEQLAPILDPGPLQGWLNQLGQALYNRQTPDGYPLTGEAWSSAGQMSRRFEIARAIGNTLGNPNAPLFRAPMRVADNSMGGMAGPMVGVMAQGMAPAGPGSGSPPAGAAAPAAARPTRTGPLAPPLSPPLGAASQAVLDQARTPQERHALLLSSPEFMYR